MKKSKMLSLLIALVMLFALVPTSAFAADDITPYSLLGSGVMHFDAATNQALPDQYDVFPDELVWNGEDLSDVYYTPVIPGTEYTDSETGTKYTLEKLVIDARTNIQTDKEHYYTITDFENLEQVWIPAGALAVGINYFWNVELGEVDPDPGEPDEPGGRPAITNFIYSVDRTVAQDGSAVTPKNDGGTDYYVVKDSDGLTLTYNTSMDMKNLGFAFNFGDGSWDFLQANKESILDETWVDLVFAFDDSIDVTTADFSAATLDSDMFVLKGDSADEWFTTNEAENTITVHCRWDQATANPIEDLDPMIYFNGLKLDLPKDWDGQDSITIVNGGDVKGQVEIGVRDNTGYVERNYIDIDGGAADDTFVLTTNDKTSLPGMDKTIVLEDGTEVDKDTVAAGDTVEFQLESNVPEDMDVAYTEDTPPEVVKPLSAVGTMESYTLVFHDKMNEKLELNQDSFEVMLGDKEIADQYVTITTSGLGDGCTFEVSVNLAAMYNADVITESDFGVTPITVNYTADLAEDAEAGAYENTAWVTWPEGESGKDTVEVLTYGINIFKYDQGKGLEAEDAGLAGAEFALYKADAEGNFNNADEYLVKEGIISGADGYVRVDGLDEGTYYLVETKAPDGYAKSDEPLKIMIPTDASEITYLVDVKFANTLIPHTGGMGTMMFTVGGAAILAAAGALFIVTRRKQNF